MSDFLGYRAAASQLKSGVLNILKKHPKLGLKPEFSEAYSQRSIEICKEN